MLTQSRITLGITTLLCFTSGILASSISPIGLAQAQPAKIQKSRQRTFKQQYDQHTGFLDKHCVWHEYQVGKRGYRICAMEDMIMAVAMDGPEGDNGPTAYFHGGKLFSFRDTGVGTAQMFDKRGRLLAEVEVGTVAPEYNKIKTQFTPAERKELTDRAMESSQHLLKVGQKWLKWSSTQP
jgi:hypothetical protein